MSPWKYAAAGITCIIAAPVALNLGVCIPEFRMLSDADYIRNAVDAVIHDPLDAILTKEPGRVILKTVQSQRYARPDDLQREFPDCCSVVMGIAGDSGEETSLLDRLLGTRLVEVSYEKRYVEFGSPQSAAVKARVAVTCCGKAKLVR
jgi:hypothetical protein